MKHLLLLISCLLSFPSLADNIVTGNTRVQQGAVETYFVQWPYWDSTYERYANVTWSASNGTVLASDRQSATIQWNTAENNSDLQGTVEVYEDLGSQSGGLAVELLNTNTSESEFCNGILGPPAVAEDFGSGGNPGPPLTGGSTTYTYNPSCAISPDQYTNTNSSVGCRSLWHGIPEDHTPNDTNGYFLMVDADDRRGEFYRTTVSGLTSAFQYEFSAWVGNLINTSGFQEPRVRFEVYAPGGGLLGTSGDIVIPFTSTFQWQRVGFMFDLPQGVTDVQVAIVNRNQSNSGNDLVIDDISFAPCYPSIIASFQNGVVVDRAHTCNNGSVNLYSWWPSTVPFTSPSFQWQRSPDNGATWGNIPGATSVTTAHTEPTPGIYQYRILSYETSNPSQSVVSNPLTYFVQRMVVVPKTYRLYSCNGSAASGSLPASYYLEFADPSVSQNFTFNWSPSTYLSNTASALPYATLPSAGSTPPPNGPPAPPINYSYMLTVTNTNYGCSASSPQTVAHHNPRKVYVPNAFTPDGDGLNDYFRPINLEDYPESEFWVFNRWGQEVFYSQGPTQQAYSWNGTFNGTPQPGGVFAWRVSMSGCWGNLYNATTGDNRPSGTVTLIR
ncbi:gliding motility-associated C-terminal domain-containing protein [Pyxidicoccus caerfyrddinensis]|uniref:gliding motility-associated C-terminal domain-containing protein n=1 Tax=Pyxidicoccus caerfyrddinensis TaxID=2709663 RepID=UPI0013DBDF47|nr:gliding motility-associated C-terminal domain-containing protein [Pyxidicoccus caerfyrddinensis]